MLIFLFSFFTTKLLICHDITSLYLDIIILCSPLRQKAPATLYFFVNLPFPFLGFDRERTHFF